MNHELLAILEYIEQERGVSKEQLVDAVEKALLTAARKSIHPANELEVKIDRNTGDLRAWALLEVVAENPDTPQITGENASFFTQGGFLYMKYPKDAEPVRVMLHRDFPFEFLWEYISVLDVDGYELASIRRMDDFQGEEREMLVQELERKYYSPVIKKIYFNTFENRKKYCP